MKKQKLAEENEDCYKIMSEIENYGISDRQRYYLIYLLAKNIEDIAIMQELMCAVREINPEAFITNNDETIDNEVTKQSIILDN